MRLTRIGPAIAVLVVVYPAAGLAQKAAAKPQPDRLRAAQLALGTGDYAAAEQGFRALLRGPQRGKALIGLGRVRIVARVTALGYPRGGASASPVPVDNRPAPR